MVSNALVHERNEVTGILKQVAPLRVTARTRLSGDHFMQGLTLFLESRNLIADINQTSRNRIRSALPPTAPCPGMTIVLLLTLAMFASAARIWPSMLAFTSTKRIFI
jgi:hypothetical protein